MTDTRDCYHYRQTKVYSTEKMKLTSSASEQNVFFTYVCLVDDLRPTEALSRDSQQYTLSNKQSNEVFGIYCFL